MDVALPSLSSAVNEYFGGERSEMLLILAGSLLLTSLTAWLWLATRSGFALALLLTVAGAAALSSTTATTLLMRDRGLVSSLNQGLASPQPAAVAAAVAAERGRIVVVVSKYRYYRYGAAAMAALSVVGLMFSHRSWVHGVAAGLLLLVVAQILIDHFSEHRARLYLTRLAPTTATASD